MASSGVISVTYEDCIPAADAPFASGVACPFLVAEEVPEYGSPGPAAERPSPDAERRSPDEERRSSPEERRPSPEETPLDGVPLLIPEWVARLAVIRRVGEGLRRFRDGRFDPLVLGPRDHVSLAESELDMSKTTAREAVRLASGLERHEELAAACESGRISRSAALLLLGVLTPETEREWIEQAEGLSCEQLGALIREYRRRTEGSPRADDPEETATVSIRGCREDLDVARVQGREMVEKVTGGPVGAAQAFEWICADWASGHPEQMADIWITEEGGTDCKRQLEALLAQGGRFAAEASGRHATTPVPAVRMRERGVSEAVTHAPRPVALPLPDPAGAQSPGELLSVLKELVTLQGSLAWQAGRALQACRSRERELDFDPASTLGASSRKAAYLLSLDRELRGRPTLRRAYVRGRLGHLKIRELLKICTERTAAHWIAWAETATLRLLERAVEAELSARAQNLLHWRRVTGGLPPDETRLRDLGILPGCAWADRERIREAANIRCEGEGAERLEALLHALEEAEIWRLRLPPPAAAVVQAVLVAAMRTFRTINAGSCARRITEEFLAACEAEHEALGGKGAVQKRDQHLCLFPGCRGRITEGDHACARSEGGSDELSNLESLCPPHHAAKHRGLFSVYGTAPHDLYFVVGKPGVYQRIWRNDRLLGTLSGDGAGIRCEADLRHWLLSQELASA